MYIPYLKKYVSMFQQRRLFRYVMPWLPLVVWCLRCPIKCGVHWHPTQWYAAASGVVVIDTIPHLLYRWRFIQVMEQVCRGHHQFLSVPFPALYYSYCCHIPRTELHQLQTFNIIPYINARFSRLHCAQLKTKFPQSSYLAPLNPGFLNECCVSLSYGKFLA